MSEPHDSAAADIRMYFHFRSPYSRLGLHRVARAGLDPELMVFTGPPPGNRFRDTLENPAMVRYVTKDILRLSARYGLKTRRPRPFDVDFGPASRAFVLANEHGRGLAFALAVSDARWRHGHDISDLGVLRDAALACELDPALVDEAQRSATARAAFATYRAAVEADGVFGVPFFIAGGQPYWGQDRIDMMLEDLAAAAA